MRFLLGLSLALLFFFSLVLEGSWAHPHSHEPFRSGDEIVVECRNPSDPENWDWKFRCEETFQPLTLRFAQEELLHCTLHFHTHDQYHTMEDVVKLEKSLFCRLPISRDRAHAFYLPFTITVLGVVEPGHMHLNLHQALVVHAHDGFLMGVSAYPIRERFQLVTPQTPINFHFTVRWFDRYSHKPLHTHSHQHSGSISFLTVMIFVALTTAVNLIVGAVWYHFHVQPKLRKADLKID